MELTQEQYERIEKYLPKQRGNVKIDNLQFLNAILYVAENGCKWRALPKEYGNWHTIYMRMNRWSKKGVLDRVFAALQAEGIINIDVAVVCLDSTTVKVHPDACGALKKEESAPVLQFLERRIFTEFSASNAVGESIDEIVKLFL